MDSISSMLQFWIAGQNSACISTFFRFYEHLNYLLLLIIIFRLQKLTLTSGLCPIAGTWSMSEKESFQLFFYKLWDQIKKKPVPAFHD